MSFILLSLLLAVAIATMIVLADSGLRLWSALTRLKDMQPQVPYCADRRAFPAPRITSRVSYARTASVMKQPLRAAA